MDHLVQHIESLIFTTDHSISLEEIDSVLEEAFGLNFPDEQIIEAIEELRERYAAPGYAFEIVEIGGGYQFLTKGAYHNTVGVFLRQTTHKRLSRSALETLSIVAYRQPVTKSELEAIRGVSCDYAMQKLLEKELVIIVGRSEGPGRPLLYATSEKFMDYFGLKSMDDLPKPKEFSNLENAIGEHAPIEEDIENYRSGAATPGKQEEE
ncbi:SMC-Scp complex subunit ScpB [Lewinella cohaerens]|uniref:SMC-Scp complex subunit ScpB n=1 Tax=Lewinella cohaerens TaxID=70995 RepID=UPI00036147E0|nr:SMC-Scp complex subunit ScpB [Lewinella cohaerens]